MAELEKEGKCPEETLHRRAKYFNNVIEADYGKLKQLIRPVRGFKTLKTAYAMIKVYANAPVASNVSTIPRLRAHRLDCEQAGRKREHRRATIVRQREPKPAMIASMAADEGKPLHLRKLDCPRAPPH